MKIPQFEFMPHGGCIDLSFPVGGKLRHLSDDCGVFDTVGELAAFGEGPKAVIVLPRGGEVVGVDGEVGVRGSVAANPCERLEPTVLGWAAGEFEVASVGEECSLRGKHGAVSEGEERGPSEGARPEKVLTEKASGDEDHEEIDQLKIAHGLQGSDPDETRRCENDHGCDLMDHSIREDGEGEAGKLWVLVLESEPPHGAEEDKRSDGAQPFVPGPSIEEVIAAGFESAAPRGGR